MNIHLVGDDEIAASILRLTNDFVTPLVATGNFYDEGSAFRFAILDGQRSLFEWEGIPSERVRNPEELAHVIEEIRLSLKGMGYDVAPRRTRRGNS
jgi:hypothetical protein